MLALGNNGVAKVNAVLLNTAVLLVPPIVMLALPPGVCISIWVVPFWIRSPKMLPLSVALPDTLKSPVIATNPALIVCTVVPATLARMLPPLAITDMLLLPLVMAVLLMFPPKIVPLTLRSPVTLTCAAVSLTATTALPLLLAILVTEVVVVISRTSIKSPLSGASVNVSTQVGSVPDTLYALVGICTTPLILTIQLLVVCVLDKVNATVEPSPLNCSSAITVNTGTPTAVH